MGTIRLSIILSLLFSTFSTASLSQTTVIDSFKNELQKHTREDTTRVNLLNLLAYNYRTNDINKAEEKCKEAHKLAKKIKYEKGIAKSILIAGKIHISKSEYPEALEDCLKSLELYKKPSIYNHKDIGAIYNTLGMVSAYLNDSDKSLEYFKKSLEIAKKAGDLRSQGDMMNNIGINYYSRGELEKAVTYFRKAIEIYKKNGKNRRTTSALNNIAVIYSIQGRYTEALEYYKKTLIINREDNIKDDIAMTTQNMGVIYSNLGQHKKAFRHYEESLRLVTELKDKSGIAKALMNIGLEYAEIKKPKKAIEHYNKAIAINKEIKNLKALAKCYMNLGVGHIKLNQPKLALKNFESSLELGESLNDKLSIGSSHIYLSQAYLQLKDYEKALHHANIGKEAAENLDLLEEQKEVNEVLSKIYQATGETQKALKHFKLYKTFNDSLFNKENIEKLAQLEYEYKYKRKLDLANIRELKLTKTVKTTTKNLEKSQQKYLWVIIASLISAMLLGGIIFYMKLRNVKSKSQNIIIEQRLLRSQMTPHFIFNSLSVLQGMIINKEEQKSVNYLSKFSKLLRIILENSRDKVVSLTQEIAAIENYLTLQNLENESYNYTVEVDESIDVSSYLVPPMLIQPFVENAVEHAFIDQKGTKTIDVHLSFIKENLNCTITDNGIGIGIGINFKKNNVNDRKTSLSTTITNERLKILSNDFKMRGSLTIKDRRDDNETGTKVTLIIPYLRGGHQTETQIK